MFPDTGQTLPETLRVIMRSVKCEVCPPLCPPVKLIVRATALEAGPGVHADDVHPGVAHCKSGEWRKSLIECALDLCEGGTGEVPQPLSGVAASVREEVGPVAGVEVRVIRQPQHHRHVGVLSLTRHLGWCSMFTLDIGGLTPITLGKQSKLVVTPWTGVWGVVWPPLPTLHPPVVHAVVVDGVSEGHLLIKQQTVLTRLQAHGPWPPLP